MTSHTIKNPNAPISEAQFNFLINLASQLYANDAQARMAALTELPGLSMGAASAKITLYKAALNGAPAASLTPAYVPPLGHYMIDGKHVHLKKSKYGSKTYVYVNNAYVGTLGHSAQALAAIAQLDSADAAYAAVVAFAKVTSKCGVCHTKLTDPKSIAAGIGPVCAKKYGKVI